MAYGRQEDDSLCHPLPFAQTEITYDQLSGRIYAGLFRAKNWPI